MNVDCSVLEASIITLLTTMDSNRLDYPGDSRKNCIAANVDEKEIFRTVK